MREETPPSSPQSLGHLLLFITHLCLPCLCLPRLCLPCLCLHFYLQVVAAISQVKGIQEVTTFSEKRAA